MIVYISKILCDKLRTEADEPIPSDSYLRDFDKEYRLSAFTDDVIYNPCMVQYMREGCVLAYFPKYGNNRLHLAPKQGTPIYKYEGTYINYRECDFFKYFNVIQPNNLTL